LTGDAIIALIHRVIYTETARIRPWLPFLAGLSDKLRVARLKARERKVPLVPFAIANAQLAFIH